MADRVTKKEINHLFALFCKANGFRLAKSHTDDGGYALDYYGIGGGYQIVQFSGGRGGHSNPFGHRRYKAAQFADLLRFGIDIGEHHTRHPFQARHELPGKPYSQYAGNPRGGTTLKQARERLRAVDMIITKSQDGEYRVNFRGGVEATAHYTDDIDDAVGTGLAMAREGNHHAKVKTNPGRKRKYKKPFNVVVWEERDRLHIMLEDANRKEIASWWDEDARQMFEDGFFARGRGLAASVIQYAEDMGLA